MAKRYPSPPKLLLTMISAIISAFTLVYGYNFGWLSAPMWYLYIFFVIYYYSICRGDKAGTCYTIAGAVDSIVCLLALKYLGPVLGLMISSITICLVTFTSDLIVKCDWKYGSLGDFNLSSFPIERSIQFKYDQHVSVSDPPPASAPVPETPKKEGEVKPQVQKKKIERTPLSRKEKKAEAKKQKKR